MYWHAGYVDTFVVDLNTDGTDEILLHGAHNGKQESWSFAGLTSEKGSTAMGAAAASPGWAAMIEGNPWVRAAKSRVTYCVLSDPRAGGAA